MIVTLDHGEVAAQRWENGGKKKSEDYMRQQQRQQKKQTIERHKKIIWRRWARKSFSSSQKRTITCRHKFYRPILFCLLSISCSCCAPRPYLCRFLCVRVCIRFARFLLAPPPSQPPPPSSADWKWAVKPSGYGNPPDQSRTKLL